MPDFQIRKTTTQVATISNCQTPEEALAFVQAFDQVLESVLVWEEEADATRYTIQKVEVPF